MNSPKAANLGATGTTGYFPAPPLPNVLAEWAALIPLVVHLASSEDDYHLVGRAALTGGLATGIFPPLGHLDGIARLLHGGLDFLDRASTKAAENATVWDVAWTGRFPSANGAARSMFSEFALRRVSKVIKVADWTSEKVQPPRSSSPQDKCSDRSKIYVTNTKQDSLDCDGPAISEDKEQLKACQLSRPTVSPSFRRYQTLHVIHVSHEEGEDNKASWVSKICPPIIVEVVFLTTLLALAVVLSLFGTYGTCAILASTIVSRSVCRFLPVERPTGYLKNNESYEACMLTAIHENASTWYLYTGDRAVIDWLLNKTMITIGSSEHLRMYFRLAHGFQLLAMTYVAAQRGWDGVCLFVLMFITWLFQHLLGQHRVVKQWCQTSQIHVVAQSFELTGRLSMLGAVQLIHDRQNTSVINGVRRRDVEWMNGILAPSQRRQVWTDSLLRAVATDESQPNPVDCQLSASDQTWVENNTRWALHAADCIQIEMMKLTKAIV